MGFILKLTILVFSIVALLSNSTNAKSFCQSSLYSVFTCNQHGAVENSNLFGLFSSSSKPINGAATKHLHKISSANKRLSDGGPSSPAVISIQCTDTRASSLAIMFPGYPMFLENSKTKVRLLVDGKSVFEFDAYHGASFFEMQVVDSNTIKTIVSKFLEHKAKQLTFTSFDQDGLEVRADFPTRKHREPIKEFTELCLF